MNAGAFALFTDPVLLPDLERKIDDGSLDLRRARQRTIVERGLATCKSDEPQNECNHK